MLTVSWDPDLSQLGSAAAQTSSTFGEDDKQCAVLQERELKRQLYTNKRCFFGVETCPELIWDKWDVGREFTKTIILKNTVNKQQKLYTRAPVSKVFSTSFPRIILIKPWMSYSSLISFKPQERQEYEDTIEFQSEDGNFQIFMRATIHQALEVPELVQLPLCAVQHSTRATFKLRNTSILQVRYQWECTDPFQLIPENGRLKPNEECHITVIFHPRAAQLYEQKVTCRFGSEEKLDLDRFSTLLLQARAKFAFLQLRIPNSTVEKQSPCPVLHFGSVPIGSTVHKQFEIINPTIVAASFSLSRLPGGVPLLGTQFRCNFTSGVVESFQVLQITVSYTPTVMDAVAVENLSLQCPGALNKSQVKLMGNCIGPALSVFPPVVDFGCVKEGDSATQTVEFVNASPADAIFQWDLDGNGHSVFKIQPACGAVRPNASITLTAIYQPTHPIAHHRKVPCLILHKEPLFLNLIGACVSGLELSGKHSGGQHGSDVHLAQHGVPSSGQEHEETDQRIDISVTAERGPMEEYFQQSFPWDPCWPTAWSPNISVEPTELLFNQKPAVSTSSLSNFCQAISVTNHTSRNLSLLWTAATDSSFSVAPMSCNLGALKSTSFRVTYTPKQLDTLHGAQLECFAYSKESPLSTPLYITLRVIGHSFQHGKKHFTPNCMLQHPRVVFPALPIPSYRSVLLRNEDDCPLTFQSPNPTLAAPVFVLPACGLVPPGKHQILALCTTPTDDCPLNGFRVHLNFNATEHSQELIVISPAANPSLSMEREATLYFQPTAVQSQTRRSHRITNLSPFPLGFQWRIKEEDREIISVETPDGALHPNESATQTWIFSPQGESMYKLDATLSFWPMQTPSLKSELNLEVVGLGCKGSIEAMMQVLDVGDIVIGRHRSIAIPVMNTGPCSISIRLTVKQLLLDEEGIYGLQNDPCALELKRDREMITSHSRILLQSTVRPLRRSQYQWTISYQTLSTNGIVTSPPQALCEVLGKAVFPTLHVVDASSGGSVKGLSKAQIWKLFSLDGFNQHLLAFPADFSSANSTMNSLNPSSLVTEVVLDFNFSASPLDADPSIVTLTFRNPGSITVEWIFLFPEHEIEEFEYLADRGVFDNTTVHSKKNHDKHVFSISPHFGMLLPGQQIGVDFIYNHDIVGTDQQPILLKFSHGREIWMNLQGMTVPRDKPYLYFASKQHVFAPVHIGDLSPPLQMYELYNSGAVPVSYEVDQEPLLQQQLDSASHPVLHCLNPMGDVLPGRTAMVEFVFSPLEAKTYHVDVPIHICGGDFVVVTFEGRGLSSLPMKSPDSDFKDAKPSSPPVKRVPIPGQLAFLSENTISLGDIPLCCHPTRIIFLTNLSNKDTVIFSWDLNDDRNQQLVHIHPEQGRLCPEESVPCVLTFASSDYPTIHQLDLTCRLFLEASLMEYQRAVMQWEDELNREPEEILSGGDWEQAPYAAKGTLMRKRKALPPIKPSRRCEAVGSACSRMRKLARKGQEEDTSYKCPVTPAPVLLHLGVTAHSHELMDYLVQFPHQFNKQHVYRSLQSFRAHRPVMTPRETTAPDVKKLLSNKLVREVLMQVLCLLLRSSLDDPTFAESLNALDFEPVYYSQLRGAAAASSSSSQLSPHSPSLSVTSLSQTCPMFSSTPYPAFAGPPPSPQQRSVSIGTDPYVEGCVMDSSRTDTGTIGHAHTPHNSERSPKLPAALMLSQMRVENAVQAGQLVDICVNILLNTLQNLMKEAARGEVDLTVHPRAIILPPAPASRRHKQT